jgi:hypothetical protein
VLVPTWGSWVLVNWNREGAKHLRNPKCHAVRAQALIDAENTRTRPCAGIAAANLPTDWASNAFANMNRVDDAVGAPEVTLAKRMSEGECRSSEVQSSMMIEGADYWSLSLRRSKAR